MDGKVISVKINSISNEIQTLIGGMLKELHKNGVIKANQNGECEIPLELPKSFNMYHKLVYNIHNNNIIAKCVRFDYEMALKDATMEFNSAILADIAIRYFETEDI